MAVSPIPQASREVFLWITELPPAARPCMISRGEEVTLVAMHPGVSRLELVAWCVDNLSIAEQNAYRAAYGQPPVGQHMQDWLLDGETLLVIPECIDSDRFLGATPLDLGA